MVILWAITYIRAGWPYSSVLPSTPAVMRGVTTNEGKGHKGAQCCSETQTKKTKFKPVVLFFLQRPTPEKKEIHDSVLVN